MAGEASYSHPHELTDEAAAATAQANARPPIGKKIISRFAPRLRLVRATSGRWSLRSGPSDRHANCRHRRPGKGNGGLVHYPAVRSRFSSIAEHAGHNQHLPCGLASPWARSSPACAASSLPSSAGGGVALFVIGCTFGALRSSARSAPARSGGTWRSLPPALVKLGPAPPPRGVRGPSPRWLAAD
jgi:hypothetical protein